MSVVPKFRIVGESDSRKPQQSDSWAGGLRLQSLGNLAHELRSPLQALLGYLDLLRDEAASPDGTRNREVLERMNSNAHHLARTVENLIEFAVDDAALQTAEENIDLRELVADLTPELEAANRAKGLTLRIDLDSAPRVIRSHRRAIHAILTNLLSNGIKFTDHGSVTLIIRDARIQGHGVIEDAIEIEVRDTGPGIDPELVDRAFEPMVQLSSSAARTHRGLGLGLAVVRRNINALRGALAVCSDRAGTSFRITIPCAIARKAPDLASVAFS